MIDGLDEEDEELMGRVIPICKDRKVKYFGSTKAKCIFATGEPLTRRIVPALHAQVQWREFESDQPCHHSECQAGSLWQEPHHTTDTDRIRLRIVSALTLVGKVTMASLEPIAAHQRKNPPWSSS